MDPESVILSEGTQTEEEKYCMTYLIYGIQKEMIQMNLLILTQEKETRRLGERTYGWGDKEEGWGKGIVREIGMDTYGLLYLK